MIGANVQIREQKMLNGALISMGIGFVIAIYNALFVVEISDIVWVGCTFPTVSRSLGNCRWHNWLVCGQSQQ